ncbi:VRR-NUC domain-containing protein [Nesterenkonia populi]|uniref:VRR-NUC domain-containing protein n=1 Tax=Nesterenkonia populi TaxID=1591087 RepID=UPI0011BDA1E6|nr:VRR-NUC domain-containing protein [Nesterenkonia populi]
MKAADYRAKLMSEGDLQQSVEQLLTLHGWTFHHETDSRKSRRGFPDLIAVHPTGRLLLVELKGYDARGRLGTATAEQQKWLDVWRQAGARIHGDVITSYAWEPKDWHSGAIGRVLEVRR